MLMLLVLPKLIQLVLVSLSRFLTPFRAENSSLPSPFAEAAPPRGGRPGVLTDLTRVLTCSRSVL